MPLPPQLNEVELEAEYNPESSNDNTDSDNDSDNDSDIENRESSDDEDVLIEDANGFNIDVRSRVAVGMTQMRRKFRLTQVSNHVIYLGIVVMELFFFEREGTYMFFFFSLPKKTYACSSFVEITLVKFYSISCKCKYPLYNLMNNFCNRLLINWWTN